MIVRKSPEQRWQPPKGLYYDFCVKMSPLRPTLADGNICLGSPGQWMVKFIMLHFCGNDDEAFSLMKRELGRPTYVKIDNLVEEIASELYKPCFMLIIAQVMSSTSSSEISLQIYRRYRHYCPFEYALMKSYIKADEFFTKALAKHRLLSSDSDTVYIAQTLCDMGSKYSAIEYRLKMEECYTEALAMFIRPPSPNTDSEDFEEFEL